ncbi:MAG: PHP domain-containing protein, partial [Planctomycetota bacterium]|nr:PHP domain-containing protein [Planctomycetota bacterium]
MLERVAVDTHTHCVLSGHAWSTLRENAAAAARRGLDGFCLTDHGHAMPGAGPFFLASAQKMLPERVAGVRVFYGVEANITDLKGGMDIDDKSLLSAEFVVASMHDLCLTPGTPRENTEAYLGVLRHPAVDVIGHMDDRRTPSEFVTVIREAGRLGKLIEINNNSLLIRKGSRERVEEMARLCGELNVEVAVASDAHFDEMIGAVEPALELLGRIGFPDRLVINRDMEAFSSYLAKRETRVDPAWNERFGVSGS